MSGVLKINTFIRILSGVVYIQAAHAEAVDNIYELRSLIKTRERLLNASLVLTHTILLRVSGPIQ